MYWKQLVLCFKVYQHLISSTLPLLNNNTASLHCNLATWMKAASEEKKKSEGFRFQVCIYLCIQVYMNILGQFSLLEMPGDFSWDAGEQLGSGKIKGCMSFSHMSHISCLVCSFMFICRCTFISSWDRKKVYFFLFQWEMIAHWNFKILQAKKYVSWWEFIGIIQILE